MMAIPKIAGHGAAGSGARGGNFRAYREVLHGEEASPDEREGLLASGRIVPLR